MERVGGLPDERPPGRLQLLESSYAPRPGAEPAPGVPAGGAGARWVGNCAAGSSTRRDGEHPGSAWSAVAAVDERLLRDTGEARRRRLASPVRRRRPASRRPSAFARVAVAADVVPGPQRHDRQRLPRPPRSGRVGETVRAVLHQPHPRAGAVRPRPGRRAPAGAGVAGADRSLARRSAAASSTTTSPTSTPSAAVPHRRARRDRGRRPVGTTGWTPRRAPCAPTRSSGRLALASSGRLIQRRRARPRREGSDGLAVRSIVRLLPEVRSGSARRGGGRSVVTPSLSRLPVRRPQPIRGHPAHGRAGQCLTVSPLVRAAAESVPVSLGRAGAGRSLTPAGSCCGAVGSGS